jgi:hypothetical protein
VALQQTWRNRHSFFAIIVPDPGVNEGLRSHQHCDALASKRIVELL